MILRHLSWLSQNSVDSQQCWRCVLRIFGRCRGFLLNIRKVIFEQSESNLPASHAGRMEEWKIIRCFMYFNFMSWLVVDLDCMSLIAPNCHGRSRCDSTVTYFHHWFDNPGSLVQEAMAWTCFDRMEQLQLDLCAENGIDQTVHSITLSDFQDKVVRENTVHPAMVCFASVVLTSVTSIGPPRPLWCAPLAPAMKQQQNCWYMLILNLHWIGFCLFFLKCVFSYSNGPRILRFFWYPISYWSSARLASSSAFACNVHFSSSTRSTSVYGKWYHIVFLVLRHLSTIIVVHV